MPSSTSDNAEVRRPTRTTDAPASASASAIARPIPELTPVTTAER
jgi:hypothetical protein